MSDRNEYISKTDEERQEMFGQCQRGLDCRDHPTEFDFSSVEEVLFAGGWDWGGWDSGSFFVARIKGGKFAVGQESSDSSGHG